MRETIEALALPIQRLPPAWEGVWPAEHTGPLRAGEDDEDGLFSSLLGELASERARAQQWEEEVRGLCVVSDPPERGLVPAAQLSQIAAAGVAAAAAAAATAAEGTAAETALGEDVELFALVSAAEREAAGAREATLRIDLMIE